MTGDITTESQDEEKQWWNARIAAFETILGAMDNTVLHAPMPLFLGGNADVVTFSDHLAGTVYVTSDLIGLSRQVPNSLGSYELMICHRCPCDWGGNIISQLAQYALENVIEPYDSMDVEPAVPPGSTLSAFLYLPYATFNILDTNCGLLLCIGITAAELDFKLKEGGEALEAKLKAAAIYPFTDMSRISLF